MTDTNDLPDHLVGNLDVPPSVWVDSNRLEQQLPEGLVAFFTRPGGLVIDTTGAVLPAAVAAGRSCVTFVADDRVENVNAILADVDTAADVTVQVRLVEVEGLAPAIAAYVNEVDLVVATSEAVHQLGWWTAVRGALRTGGHAAIVCASADSRLGSLIVTTATSSGMVFTQHIVAVSSAVLDAAVAAEANQAGKPHGRVRRTHRDVYVFRNPVGSAV